MTGSSQSLCIWDETAKPKAMGNSREFFEPAQSFWLIQLLSFLLIFQPWDRELCKQKECKVCTESGTAHANTIPISLIQLYRCIVMLCSTSPCWSHPPLSKLSHYRSIQWYPPIMLESVLSRGSQACQTVCVR